MHAKDGAPDGSRKANDAREVVVARPEQLFQPATRRNFLRALGLGGSIVMLPAMFAACDDDDDPIGPGDSVTLNLNNDFGILNYAYALEQLEAAFYVAVLGSTAFGGMSAEQREVFTDLRNHEVIHREFLRRALGTNAIPDLALDQTTAAAAVASTTVILRNAEMFEDLGVAAYNGAGKYLSSADYLGLAGKIVSVEARHAAAIRDLREASGVTTGAAAGTRFAGDDVVIASGTYAGLDVKLEPMAVLGRVTATGLVETEISIGSLPPDDDGTPDFSPPDPTP
jgi:rubrerythrin